MTEERLQKILARAGVSSRRAAEDLIREGRVQVNGVVVRELGTKADPTSAEVRVDGKAIGDAENRAYYLLYKPERVVTTLSDPEGRKSVGDLLAGVKERVYPVGRLDYDAEGALILTNDGELAHKLTHPRWGIQRVYLAKVKGEPGDDALARLTEGVRLEDGKAKAIEATFEQLTPKNTWIKIVVAEGRHHLVKRLCDAIGHPVVRLFRSSYAGLGVTGMRAGEVRALTGDEVRRLRKAVAHEAPVPAGGRPKRRRSLAVRDPILGTRRERAPYGSKTGSFPRGEGTGGGERTWGEGGGGRGFSGRPPPIREGGRSAAGRFDRGERGPPATESGGRPRSGGGEARSRGAPPRGGRGPARGGAAREGAPRGGFNRPRTGGGAERGERPRTGGASARGSFERPRTGGAERGSFERPRTGGAERGSFERPRTGGAERGSFERPRTGGASARGSFERPRTGGASARGGFERPRTGGASERGSFERPRTGGASERSSAGPARGGAPRSSSGGPRSGGPARSGGGGARGSSGPPRSGGGREASGSKGRAGPRREGSGRPASRGSGPPRGKPRSAPGNKSRGPPRKPR